MTRSVPYGVVDPPSGPIDADGVIADAATMVEKPAVEDAPSEFIIIGRYVLTPTCSAQIANLEPGSGR